MARSRIARVEFDGALKMLLLKTMGRWVKPSKPSPQVALHLLNSVYLSIERPSICSTSVYKAIYVSTLLDDEGLVYGGFGPLES